MEDRLLLDYIEDIEVTIKLYSGEVSSMKMTALDIKERSKSVLFQTVGNAISFPTKRFIADTVIPTLRGGIFDEARKVKLTKKFIPIVDRSWNKEGSCHFYINDIDYIFDSREEAEQTLALVRMINYYTFNK